MVQSVLVMLMQQGSSSTYIHVPATPPAPASAITFIHSVFINYTFFFGLKLINCRVADDNAPPLVQSQIECSNAPRPEDFVSSAAAAAGNTTNELAHSRPVVVAFRLDKHDDKVIKIEER